MPGTDLHPRIVAPDFGILTPKYCPLRQLVFSPQYAPHFGCQDPAVCGVSDRRSLLA